jgi:hypothetical protein
MAALLGAEQQAVAVAADQGVVPLPRPAEMRGEQDIEAKIGIAGQDRLDQQHVAVALRRDPQRELEARMPVYHLHRRDAGACGGEAVVGVPLHLGPEAVAIGHDEAEVADLRQVDARVIDLVHDAVAQGEPEARGADGGADDVLRAAGPARRNAGGARGSHGRR